MDLPGLCDVCKNAGKLHTCILCGKRVCSKCFLPAEGVCIVCRRGRAMDPGDSKATRIDPFQHQE